MTVHPIRPPRDYAEPFVDVYASLAAESLPDSGPISQRTVVRALIARFRRTVAGQAPDLLAWVTIVVCLLLLVSGTL